MFGFAALGRLALGRFKGAGTAVALPASAGALTALGHPAQPRLRLASQAGGASAGGASIRFTQVWSAGGGATALSSDPAVLRVSVPAQAGTGAILGYAARFRLVLLAETGAFVLTGIPVFLGKTTPGGGDDHVITFRAGGPAFTRRRYRRMLDERAAAEAAAAAAAARAEAAARANADAAAFRAAEARHRRFQARDAAAALAHGALGDAHAHQSLLGAQALTARSRSAEEMLGVATAAAARIEDDNDALALLLAA